MNKYTNCFSEFNYLVVYGFIKNKPERINIATLITHFPLSLFGTHVIGGAHHHAGLGEGGVADLHAVVQLVLLFEATQDHDRVVDRRFADAMVDLHRRGFDVVIVVVPVAGLLAPWAAEHWERRVALRLWEMERRDRAAVMRTAGVALVEWEMERPLELVVRAVEAVRKRRVRVR